MSHPIYLDYNATTPVAPEVLDAMLPWLRERVRQSVEHATPTVGAPRRPSATARDQVAALIGAQAGGDRLHRLRHRGQQPGPARRGARARRRASAIWCVSAVEHPAVMAPALICATRAGTLTVLPVDAFGRVSPDDVAQARCGPTRRWSRSCTPTTRWARCSRSPRSPRMTRARGILLHTDAAQSAGKMPRRCRRHSASTC